MRDDAEAAEPSHVLDDITRLAAERVRRPRQAQRDVVLSSTPSMTSTSERYCGGSGSRVPSP
jgi:hypothetical protein